MKEIENIPLYQRIRIQLYKNISSNVLKVGDAIPTEDTLMKRFNASRTTVRHAMSDLVNEGIIIRKPGKGSFVCKKIAKTNVKLQGSYKDLLAVAKSTLAKVLRFEYVEAPPEILKELKVKGIKRVLRIDRVRFAHNTPFLYSINYLPEDVGQFLSKKDIEDRPVAELLSKKCHLVLKSAVQNFNATVADDLMADILKVPIGFPLLEIKRITLSSKDRPVNLFWGFFRPDLYVFIATFSYDDIK